MRRIENLLRYGIRAAQLAARGRWLAWRSFGHDPDIAIEDGVTVALELEGAA